MTFSQTVIWLNVSCPWKFSENNFHLLVFMYPSNFHNFFNPTDKLSRSEINIALSKFFSKQRVTSDVASKKKKQL